ncbi:MAG: hypothetical protein LC797_15435 [Chloroflexi bacterium]|nr:hypothetical protein [Chloroflexota bacterium]
MAVKDDLHDLVDELDEAAAREVLVLLQDLRLPRALREVRSDDKPKTDEEREFVEEARQDLATSRVVSHAEIRRGEYVI